MVRDWFRVRVNDLVPNPAYRGHTGIVVDLLYERDGTEVAEVSWDEPFPIPNARYKLINVKYLERIPSTDLSIQELP